MVSFRIATQPEDMQTVADLELTIWGIAARDIFPPHMLSLAQHHGGVVFVAEDNNQIIGFCMGFPARRENEWCLWSYIAGVHPSYQGQTIGETLKREQRQWARDNGYQSVHWTFDPLQARNANFNLNRLGVVVRNYHDSIYGVMKDAINDAGLPSDRLEAVWTTSDEHQNSKIVDEPPHFLVQSEENLPVINFDVERSTQHLAIAMPPIRDENLALWQDAMRRAFKHAFSMGYEGYRFISDSTQPHYLLRKRR